MNYSGCDQGRVCDDSEEWREGEPKEPTQVRMTNRYSPQIYAPLLLEPLRDAGVQVLFDCLRQSP